jgi:Putative auto-transporter adhesin, head GIN domain
MRTFLLALFASHALTAPTGAATRNFGITDFTKIRVDGPYKVTFTSGAAPFARARGSGPGLDRLTVEVRGETLVVQANTSGWGGYPGENPGPVEVSVGTHELTNAWVNGAGSLIIDRVRGLSFALSVQGSGRGEIAAADADQLNVSLVGTASAKLAGQAKKLTALVRGISALDATDLAATDASIGTEGAGTVDANVKGEASIDASGPATIRLSGRPTCTLRTGSSATVDGCR